MKIIKNKTKEKYYSLDKILTVNADYNLIFGERSNGKSYAVKEYCVKRFIECGEQCVFVRRYDSDNKRGLVDSYWSDLKIDVISNGEYNEVYTYGGGLYVAYNVNGKRTKAKQFGYVRSLTLAQSYSGTQYPHVATIVLEEFISISGDYLPNELFLWTHLISTIARRRNLKIFMLANSISRISPYWREFAVDEIVKNQEIGTIAVIERDTADGDTQTVAIEYCNNTTGRSKLFASDRSSMINEGKWLTTEQPKLPRPRDDWECLYTFVIQYKKDKFLCEYVVCDGDFCIYVTPKTTPIQDNTRVISDVRSPNPLYTYGLLPITRAEIPIIDLIKNGKTFFCDNQTGTEFAECLKNIRKIYI